MRRTLLTLTAVTLLFGACARGDTSVGPAAAGDTLASTTTAPPATTTTATAPTTTTEAPRPPPLAESGAKAVVSPTGIVVPVLGREGDALVVGTPCERTALLASGIPLLEAHVVIDAGHGGPEPGAVGPGGLTETEVNLAVAEYTKAALEARGISAVLTRTGEYRMTLEARARVVRALGPGLFVSVHHNAEPDGPFPRPGSETYYQVASAESKRAAGLVYEELISTFSQYEAAWMADTDAGAKYRRGSSGDDYYGILRRTQGTPAVLSEALFVSNPTEEALLARDDVRRAEAGALARAAERFLTTDDPGSGFTEPYPRDAPAGGGGGRSPTCVDPPLT